MNQLQIHRHNGTETFPISTAKCFTVGLDTELTLWFEIETISEGAKCCSDTEAYPERPQASLGIRVDSFDIEKFVGCDIFHQGTLTDDEDSCDALFYYYEHQPLRDNRVAVLSRSDTRTFRIKWTARTQDVVDFRDPDATIEIECDFEVRS